jgi:hypothetical protein
MAAEFGRLILETLEKLPKDHVDRKFLKEEYGRFARWESLKELQVVVGEQSMSVSQAREELMQLIDAKNAEREGISLEDVECNERFRESRLEENGGQSVFELLPTNFVLYRHLANPLLRSGIFTMQKLADTSEDYLKKMRNVGPVRLKFFKALRNLAIAESRVQASNKPQV